MSKIILGKAKGKPVSLDLDVLLRTRLLIQANSGGGKSWLLRRLAEQLFGKIPVIVIDPEGEFASLREKFGYVLVGKGGETPADTRSAQLVAHRLLELRASAVCDIYELKPQIRHAWVRLFLEALVDAPKKLWKPTIIIVDESHVYSPEKGQGESEAFGAMSDLVTRGRKRGFCPIFATQRLAKLSKNVSAEMLNRLVGQTFEDIDLDRASDLLSVPRADREKFSREMKVIEPGNFWGLGRAIAKDRVLFKVGLVTTTHPEPGKAGYSDIPPPPPEKVRALLPKLSDLPQAAEEKAKTEAELRSEIRSLKAQLSARPKEIISQIKPNIVEVSILKEGHCLRLERICKGLQEAVHNITTIIAKRGASAVRKVPHRPPVSPKIIAEKPTMPLRLASASISADGGPLDKAMRAILGVLVQYPEGCGIGKLALLSGYRQSGGFRNSLSSLRSLGYIAGGNTQVMRITPTGEVTISGQYDPLPFGQELTEYWLRHPSLGQCERKALRVLLDHPEGLGIEDLAQESGYGMSGGFRNALSNLRTAGLLTGRNTEIMRIAEDLVSA